MTTITLNQIRKKSPCQDGWEKLLKHLGKTKADDEPISLAIVLESNGIQDAIWCLRALPDTERPKIVEFSCRCAESMLPHFEKKFPGDDRPRKAIAAARAYVAGEISREELRYAASSAAAAYDVSSSAVSAAVAAYAAAAYVAADEEAYAAYASSAFAYTASAAADVERKKQAAWFVEIFTQ